MEGSDDQIIEEISAWFDERGFDLYVHEVPGQDWRAPYMRKDSPIGNSDYGVGKSAREAAEDAKARYAKEHTVKGAASMTIEIGLSTEGRVYEKEGSLHAGAALGGTAERDDIPDLPRIAETLTGHGWRVWFEPEPDGKFTGILGVYETGEILKTALGADFDDAWLALGIDTTLPSDEVRQERNRRGEEPPSRGA